jgi:nitroimidazol reductase NimA-like FMN-containing flavoprotein (pyridoxamine 5'-phosphate oxidase superfamily)
VEHRPHPDAGQHGLEDLTYEECLDRVGGAVVGRVALNAHEQLVVVPVNHRVIPMDGKLWIVFRTQPDGLLDDADVRVAFEVDDADPETRTGWSVLVQGTLHRLDPDTGDVRERFDPDPWPSEARERWMAIEPFTISGRRIAGG